MTAKAEPITITEKGAGPLSAIKSSTDEETTKAIQAALASYPDLVVSQEVMELPGEGEAEQSYFSVKKGEKEVLQILEVDGAIEIHAVDPMFATTDGIKPGDKAAVLAEKRKDVTCGTDPVSRLGFLTCVSAAEPHVVFAIDAEGYKTKAKKPTKVELSTLTERSIFAIVR